MKKLLTLLAIILALASCNKNAVEEAAPENPLALAKAAPVKQTVVYNASFAAAYAKIYWDSYANPACPTFVDFGKVTTFGSQSNCTNFVNQSILAGLANTTSPSTAYNKIDFRLRGTDDWYYYWIYNSSSQYYKITDKVRTDLPKITDKSKFYYWAFTSGSAWRGAQEFQSYVQNHKWETQGTPTNTGLYFKGITNDYNVAAYPSSFNDIQVGDIICVKYYSTDKFGHVLIVTSIDTRATGYKRIKVTSQENDYVDYTLDSRRLANSTNGKPTFACYVYRPLYYIYYK